MERLELYSLANDVLTLIVNDLSDGLYAEIDGSLALRWSESRKVTAWAESHNSPSDPPRHYITFTYALVLKIYQDVLAFDDFFSNPEVKSKLSKSVETIDYLDSFPHHISKKARVHNMFLGALTWIFFHELGHLMQEHIFIVSLSGRSKPTTLIEDCETNGQNSLDFKSAALSHTLEFAADIEAINWCRYELLKHFLPSEEEMNRADNCISFDDSLFIFVAGISNALYLFHSYGELKPEEFPRTTHPHPFRRIEMIIPHLYEHLDLNGFGIKIHGMNRTQLVQRCASAMFSVGILWALKKGESNLVDMAVKGILQDPYKTSYWTIIIKTWDEIERDIKKVRRFGSEFGILFFSADFRSMMLN